MSAKEQENVLKKRIVHRSKKEKSMFWAWTDNLIIVLLLVQLGLLYCDELLRSRIHQCIRLVK